MQAQEYLMMLSKRNGTTAESEEKEEDLLEIDEFPEGSNVDEVGSNMNHAQKLRKMHKAVTQILQKTQKTKEHLRNLRQEVEVTCEEMKNEPEEGKNESNDLDISEISSPETENVWDEIKNLEMQVLLLKEKVKGGEESIKNRKKNGEEIKSLIHELENLQNSPKTDKFCECNACTIF